MKKQRFEKRRLGKTGFEVTVLGIGGAWLGNLHSSHSREVGIQTVLAGLESGINLVDTSDNYIGGESEGLVGEALQHWFEQGNRREDLIVSTKITDAAQNPGAFTYDGTMRGVERALGLLRLDYLDIMHVHDPTTLDPVLAEEGSLTALQRLKDQGTIRAIGLGCRPHEFHRTCIETGEFDVSLTFHDYNLLDTSAGKGVLETAMEHDVGVFNATTNAGRLLGGEDPYVTFEQPAQRTEKVEDARRLWLWCRERGLDLGTLNLHFCLREMRFSSVLIGFSRPARVRQNVAAYGTTIEPGIWDELARDFPIELPEGRRAS